MIEVEIAVTSGGVLVGKPLRTSVLVDSGADTTMLDGGLAATLGIDLNDPRLPKGTVGGVGKGGVDVTRANVRMSLCGRWLTVPADFTHEPIQHPQLLGRAGAFEGLLVAFVHGQTTMFAAAA